MNNIKAIYQGNRNLDTARGYITISVGYNERPNHYDVSMLYNQDTNTAYAGFNLFANSLENAQDMYYNQVLPEIERKERRYIAVGSYDNLL